MFPRDTHCRLAQLPVFVNFFVDLSSIIREMSAITGSCGDTFVAGRIRTLVCFTLQGEQYVCKM
jgi:hypothetical protein